MKKIIALVLLLSAPSALADDMPLLGVSQGQSTGFVPPPPGEALLASNGTSFIFASNGTSHICLSGVTSC